MSTQRFLLELMGHTNDWRQSASPWVAARLNQPLQAFQTLPHGTLAAGFSNSFSFISCNNSNVMVKALKKAENSNEVVVRLQELAGQSQTVQLTCVGAITAARQLGGTESQVATLTPSSGKLTVSLPAYAQMTLALTLAASGTTLPKPA